MLTSDFQERGVIGEQKRELSRPGGGCGLGVFWGGPSWRESEPRERRKGGGGKPSCPRGRGKKFACGGNFWRNLCVKKSEKGLIGGGGEKLKRDDGCSSRRKGAQKLRGRGKFWNPGL